MKVLITGKGGREHALAWKVSKSPTVSTIYVAPGNPGCTSLDKVHCVDLHSPEELLDFAEEQDIDLTIVGSEDLLIAGIVDCFTARGRKIFGPDRHSAMLEGSKAFAKKFMNKYGVKTANYRVFSCPEAAETYLKATNYPVVIKASGPAAGKGVIIAENYQDAARTVNEILLNKIFGDAGNEIVIEEYLSGVEASMLCVTDCKTILPLLSAKDHKKIGDGETGPNTGGMGAIAPNPYMNDENMKKFIEQILNPTLIGIQKEKMDFAGIIFFGLMITSSDVYLLEYNMRMGDPETQAILPLLKSDIPELITAACDRKLCEFQPEWDSKVSCCIVAAKKGYPGNCSGNTVITGIENFFVPECILFTAGVGKKGDRLIAGGGRVLNVVAVADTPESARKNAYRAMDSVSFADKYIRNDIGVIR